MIDVPCPERSTDRDLALHVLHSRLQLLEELLDAVAQTMEVDAEAHNLVNHGGRFLDMRVAHPTEPQLLSMEGGSVGAVDG